MTEQLNLFESTTTHRVQQPQQPLMSQDALIKWKTKIFDYQQKAVTQQSPQQISLFDTAPTHCDVDTINPFELKLHSSQFYRMREQGDRVCIYFIIDNTLPLLLYVGETKQTAKQRWNGVHDAKDYVSNYIELHRKHQLEVRVCSAFWYDTPSDRRSRLKLESQLIKRFSTPFNKENWQRWGQPFGKI